MKLKNVLIVVKDMEKSRQFYHDLFGLELIRDNEGNMILTEGLVLQEEKIWKGFLGKDIIPESNSCGDRSLCPKAGKAVPVHPVCQSAYVP